MPADVIVAVSTPPGRGAIGVVRLSGDGCIRLAATCLDLPCPPDDLEPARQYVAWVVADEGGERAPVDEAVVSVRRAPRSYTGEEMVEVHLHGGRAVAARTLTLLAGAGARLAGPGEFTMRAFLNGKMDLARAEAVAQIIAADSRAQLDCASRALAGGLSREVGAIYTALLDMESRIEASIEFPDDGAAEAPPDEVARAVEISLKAIEALAATFREGRLIAEGARVVIAGRPNVGKSSMLNAFTGEERAIVTEHPGTTRDPVEALLDWDGMPVRLVDTAGLRETGDPIEMIGRDRTVRYVAAADVVVCVVDGSQPLDPDDAQWITPLADRAVVALNKADLPKKVSHGDLCAALGRPPDKGPAVIACSALTGAGLTGVRAGVTALLTGGRACASDAVMVTNARHHALLCEARDALARARDTLAAGWTEDLAGGEIECALRALGAITGSNVSADVLETVFSKFCVGK